MQLVHDFLGSTQVFANAVTDVVEARLLREVAGGRITLSQFKLLKLVANTNAHSIGDVAAFLGVSNAAASKAVDKLVRRKMLHRAEGAADRRAAELSLTPRAQRLLAAYDARRDERLREIFRPFSPAQLERVAETLDRLSAGIIDHHARPEEVCLQCGIYFREKCLVRKLVGRRCFYTLHKLRRDSEPVTESQQGQREEAR
jgi:DNA-binding MarR family transcriptional regulator